MRNDSLGQVTLVFLWIVLVIGAILLGLSIATLPARPWIALVMGTALLFFALYQPMVIIALLLMVCPFGRLWEPGGIAVYELGYSLTFLLVLAASFGRRFSDAVILDSKRGLSSPLTYPLLSLLLISVVSGIASHVRGVSFVGWTSDLNIILFYGLYFTVFYNLRTEKLLYATFLLALTAVCVNIIFYRIPVERFAIMVPRLGTFAATLYTFAVFFPTLCLALFYRERAKRTVFILITILLLVGITLAFGRSRWLGLLGGLAFLFLFLPPFNRSRLIRLIFLLLIIILIYILFCVTFPFEHYLTRLPLLLWERLGSMIKIQEELPIVTRISESMALLKKIRQHPFVGHGIGATITYVAYDLVPPRSITTRYIHNSYLFFLFKVGVVGFIAFSWLCVTFIIYSVKVALGLPDSIYKALVLGFVSSFIGTLIASITAPDIISPIFSVYIGFIFGAVAIIDKNVKKIKQP